MNKVIASLGKASMAAMIGYEVGQINKDEKIIHIEIPTTTTQKIYTDMAHDNTAVKDILFLIVFLLFVVIAFIFSRFLSCKYGNKRANSIEV